MQGRRLIRWPPDSLIHFLNKTTGHWHRTDRDTQSSSPSLPLKPPHRQQLDRLIMPTLIFFNLLHSKPSSWQVVLQILLTPQVIGPPHEMIYYVDDNSHTWNHQVGQPPQGVQKLWRKSLFRNNKNLNFIVPELITIIWFLFLASRNAGYHVDK